jgi:Uma2 family endonuclease
MTILAADQQCTPDDVLRLEDEGLFELVDGQLIEKQMSTLANETAGRVATLLSVHTWPGNLGRVWPEQTIQCFPADPKLVRRPDVAFVSASRIGNRQFSGHVTIAPDIIVEVISPNDKYYEVEEKLIDYESAGVRLVWVVNPERPSVMIYRRDGSVSRLRESDTLTGEDVLPDFKIKLADLVRPVDSAAEAK